MHINLSFGFYFLDNQDLFNQNSSEFLPKETEEHSQRLCSKQKGARRWLKIPEDQGNKSKIQELSYWHANCLLKIDLIRLYPLKGGSK